MNTQYNSLELIENLDFCIFDLETTGSNCQFDKIIEIGLVKIKKLKIIEEKRFLINPEIKIPEFIQRLTRIKQSDVGDAPLIEEVIHEIVEFMKGQILIAHNTSFDVPFFNSVLKRLNLEELPNKSICTQLMTKHLIPNLLTSNLRYMSKIFNLPHSKAHRALDDARATAHLLQVFLNIFINKGIQKVNHLYYPKNYFELDRIHLKKSHYHDHQGVTEKLESLYRQIKKINSSFLITVKGKNGSIIFALPCLGHKEEFELIHRKIEQKPWVIITFKLFGPFIENLIHFNNFFNQLIPSAKKETISFLWKQHLPHIPVPTSSEEKRQKEKLGDYLMANHLVPEQLIIFPLQALNLRNQLIFRYPGHQKKLLQYLKKIRLSSSPKIENSFSFPLFKQFIEYYLMKEKKENHSLLFIDKNLTRSQKLFEKMDQFLTQNQNPYQYPQEHI